MSIAYAHSDTVSGASMAPSAAAVAAGVQPEEMNPALLIQIVLGAAVIVVVIIAVVFQLMNLTVQSVETQLAAGVGQSARASVEHAAAIKLTQYAVSDAQVGTYRIPIERAMELIASETYQQPGTELTDEVRLLPSR